MINENAGLEGIKISTPDHDELCKAVRCDVCLNKVPLSVAKSAEGLDYVHYFCGLNCLEKWQAQAQTKVKATPGNK